MALGSVSCAAGTWPTAGGRRTSLDKDTTEPDGDANTRTRFPQNRDHKGLDIVCQDGSTVYAPFDVTLHGKLTVYTDRTKDAINEGINLRGEGLCFKLFYVRSDRTSGTVRKGERIGTMLPMQSVYRGITSHVHVQMCDRSDPTPYI
ncbi:leukocyte cell-derived chemotaxin-2-like isoform X2 [Embiotoca jacksoni]|uniref:leukocyte cell-derived chemotaxin-2-like isoform X2 n=1 Tax=Embiotoca jacksoni TaxID=100190 RepID=UPI003704D3A3